MEDWQIIQMFDSLYQDIRQHGRFSESRPLLAHYTSLKNLELILKSDEIWFSNPLFMNDIQEVRFGIMEGITHFLASKEIEIACATKKRFEKLKNHFVSFSDRYSNEGVIDTYVFCLSEHIKTDNDGLLSMWRGYGENGNGAAIVFDSAKINDIPNSPLTIGKVVYASSEQRITWLRKKITEFSMLLNSNDIPYDKLHLAAYAFFDKIKLFAVYSKHHGFQEEREWRVVYNPDQDRNKLLHSMFGYLIGQRGVEPKLKFKVEPIGEITDPNLTLSNLVDRIILGPSISSPIAKASIIRMLQALGKSEFKDRIVASSIPFREL